MSILPSTLRPAPKPEPVSDWYGPGRNRLRRSRYEPLFWLCVAAPAWLLVLSIAYALGWWWQCEWMGGLLLGALAAEVRFVIHEPIDNWCYARLKPRWPKQPIPPYP